MNQKINIFSLYENLLNDIFELEDIIESKNNSSQLFFNKYNVLFYFIYSFIHWSFKKQRNINFIKNLGKANK